MNNSLVRYRIITDRGSGIVAGNYIEVFWDDVNNVFVVHKFDDENDTSGTVMTSGPDLGADRIDHVPVTAVAPIPYSFCDGLNLQTFRKQSLFPYANKVSTPNHFSCLSTVCDLQIGDDFTIQAASDFVTPDGAVEVVATSSNGEIRYSLNPDFVFSEGQVSGLFAGLMQGAYTITAKDELGCIDQITITIPVPQEHGVLYRFDYKDVNQIPSRVDILERGYVGEIIEVDGGPDPFVLTSEGSGGINKFTPVVPSTGVLTLWSPSNFYFRDLFTQDDRKYQMRHYKNYGNTDPSFVPAALPALEDWVNVNYDGAGSEAWSVGALPSVTVASSIVGGATDLYRTDYAFEEGRTYSFGYTFRSGVGYIAFASILIQIVDASNNVLAQRVVNMAQTTFTTDPVTQSGVYSFVAPSGAVGITFQITSWNLSQTFYVDAFTNETPGQGGASGYELKWLGHPIPNNYSESYAKDPYPVIITATDGLADLKNFDFLDKDGNKYRDDITAIDAIAEILAKTDLGINIQTVINRFETRMSQAATDDPLAQCKFSPETFYHEGKMTSCMDVLSEILKPFGAVIKQRKGKWFIANPEELVTSANYREFDSNGTLITNGTVEDIVNIKGAIFADRAVMEGGGQMLEVVPAYGKLFFEHTLLKNASLIKSHGFEKEDTYFDSNGVEQLRNWNINIANAPGATYGIKETKALEGDYNLYLKYGGGWATDIAGFGEVVVTSTPIEVEYENEDAFEFRFGYASLIGGGETGFIPWIKLKWSLKVGAYYFNETTGEWTTDALQKYNDVLIERFNETLEKKITAPFRVVGALTLEAAQVEFVLTNNTTYDFASIAALKDTPTTTKPIGAKMKVFVSSTIVHYYVLREGTDAESLPDVVRPNDYAASTNERIWVSEDSRTVRGRHVDYNYLDNVVLLHFPKGAEPPEDVTIERTNNAGIKVNLEEAYLLNDIDIDNINNSERTYKNYFKLLNGLPTQTWERTYRPGQGKLLDLLSNDVVSQYKTPSNKITGSFLIDREVLPTSILNEVSDNNRKYMFMGYELNDKHATISFDIVEIKDTVTDDESEVIDAGFSTGFSLGFRS